MGNVSEQIGEEKQTLKPRDKDKHCEHSLICWSQVRRLKVSKRHREGLVFTDGSQVPGELVPQNQ